MEISVNAFLGKVEQLLSTEESQAAKNMDMYMHVISRDVREIDYSSFDLETLNEVLEDALAYVPLDVIEEDDPTVNIGLSVHEAEVAWSVMYGIFHMTERAEDLDDDFF